MVMDKARLWWKTRTPEQKRNYKVAGVVSGLIGAVVIGSILAPKGMGTNGTSALKEAEKTNATALIEKPKNMTPQEQTAELSALKKQVSSLENIVKSQSGLTQQQMNAMTSQVSKNVTSSVLSAARNGQAAPGATGSNPQLAELENQISALQDQISASRYTPPPTMPAHPFYQAQSIAVLGGEQPASSQSQTQGSAASAGGIPGAPTAPKKVVGLNLTPHAKKVKDLKKVVKVNGKNSAYLPAGTILTGVLLNGMQASTGPSAQANPQITDIRVKMRAILPNRLRANFKNCMVIASGYGDLSSKRVYMRSNVLSCVARGGGIISAPIHGYVVGSDGLVGVRGKVISHQGGVMLKSLIAGIFSGLGSAAQPSAVQGLNINPVSGGQQTYQLPSPSYLGGEALGGGVSTAAGNISKFYLHEAESLLPTIQVNPGVSVDLILEKGAKIHVHGDTKAQLAQAEYQSASMNQPEPTYSGQSPAVASAFPEAPGYAATQQSPTAQQRAQFATNPQYQQYQGGMQ